jgi:hypothetical protein
LAWNAASPSLTWIDGWDSLDTGSTAVRFYDYGDVAGCPLSGTTACYPIQGNTTYNWAFTDVYRKLYGDFGALAFPQDYSTCTCQTTAQRLANFSRYRVNHYGGLIGYSGVLTQQGACSQSTSVPSCATLGTNASPALGWQNLVDQLATTSSTTWNPQYSDDIRFMTP